MVVCAPRLLGEKHGPHSTLFPPPLPSFPHHGATSATHDLCARICARDHIFSSARASPSTLGVPSLSSLLLFCPMARPWSVLLVSDSDTAGSEVTDALFDPLRGIPSVKLYRRQGRSMSAGLVERMSRDATRSLRARYARDRRGASVPPEHRLAYQKFHYWWNVDEDFLKRSRARRSHANGARVNRHEARPNPYPLIWSRRFHADLDVPCYWCGIGAIGARGPYHLVCLGSGPLSRVCVDCYDSEDEPLPRFPCAFERVNIDLARMFSGYENFPNREVLLERVAEMLYGDSPWYHP